MSVSASGERDSYKSVTICTKDLIYGKYRLEQPFYARGMRVESAFFCNVLKNIPVESYFMLYIYDDAITPAFSSYQINIAAGNYSFDQLVSAIQSRLDALVGAGLISITVNPNTLKVTFTYNGFKLIRVGTAEYSTLIPNISHMLGFTKDQTRSVVLTGDRMVNFAPRNLVHVYSRNIGSKLSDNFHSSYKNDRNILASLHVTEPFGAWISTLFPAPAFMSFDGVGSRVLIDTIDLSFKDEYLEYINFEGFPAYCELSFI